ncbi:MAG: EAL domain-containing protein [Acidimicrobiales bacterium]|nr:EAL domain-containing protein [Acidimicrobiales bacterium]
MSLARGASQPTSGQGQALHDPARRLDVAFAALDEIGDGAFGHCLGPGAGSTGLPPVLGDQLPTCRWTPSHAHPLRFIDPSDHLTVHHAWLEACAGPERVGRTTVRVVAPLAPDDGGRPGEPGTYEIVLIDLVGVADIDAVVVALEPTAEGGLPVATGVRALAEVAEGDELGFRALAEALPVGVAVLDERGAVHFANHRLVTLTGELGIAEAETIARATATRGYIATWTELVSDEFARGAAHLLAPRAPDDPTASGQVQVHGSDGAVHHLLVQAVTVGEAASCRVIVSVLDVTAEVATLGAHRRLSQVVDGVHDIVIVTTAEGRVTFANQAARRYLGERPTDIEVTELPLPALRRLLGTAIAPAIERNEVWTGDIDVADPDGRTHTMSATVTPVEDPERHAVQVGVTMRDVTTKRAHERELAQQARSDMLTGLPNRLALMEALEERRRSGPPTGGVAVFFIDLDHLKIVNDGLGHTAGDRLLNAVARELRAAAGTDLLARFGGDEFVVLVEDAHDGLDARATRYLEAVGRARVPGVASHLSASIGIATASRRALDPESLIRDADAAMYAAKRAGRGRAAQFDDRLREQARRRFEVARELRAAVEAEELTVALQPVVTVADGVVRGFEALCRWDRATPGEFIPVAEESGLIVPIGEQVLHQALAHTTRLRAELPHLRDAAIGVNVSACELDDPGFAPRVIAAIEASEVPATRIVLELTESVLIDPREEVTATLGQLRDAGIELALDDFGSGYSSLTYLRRYPIDILKLDITYTQAMATDPESRIIVESLASMAERLGIHVLAEGVETPEQLQVARELEMTWVQGYLLGRPASVDDHLTSGVPSRAGLFGP